MFAKRAWPQRNFCSTLVSGGLELMKMYFGKDTTSVSCLVACIASWCCPSCVCARFETFYGDGGLGDTVRVYMVFLSWDRKQKHDHAP